MTDVNYSGFSFGFSEDTSPAGIAFNDDGMKMFMSGTQNDTIYEYNLTTAYSLQSGVSYSGFSFVISEDTAPAAVVFNDDGSKMFVLGGQNDTVYEYDLTTPYSLQSGVSYSGFSFAIGTQDDQPEALTFNDDGSKMFMVGIENRTIYEYDLTTPYSLQSGVSYSGFSFVVAEDISPEGLAFSGDGKKMIVVGNSSITLYEYDLTTPYSLQSGVSYTGRLFIVFGQATSPKEAIFNDDGSKIFLLGSSSDTVYEYNLPVPYSLASSPSKAIIGLGTQLQIGDGQPSEAFTTIAEVLSVTAFSLSTDAVDVTNMDSPDKYKEFIPGLRDGGEISFDINYIFDEATHLVGDSGILKDFNDTETKKRNFKIIFPDTAVTTWEFTGIITGFTNNSPTDAAITASITIKVTSKPVFV